MKNIFLTILLVLGTLAFMACTQPNGGDSFIDDTPPIDNPNGGGNSGSGEEGNGGENIETLNIESFTEFKIIFENPKIKKYYQYDSYETSSENNITTYTIGKAIESFVNFGINDNKIIICNYSNKNDGYECTYEIDGKNITFTIKL